VNHFIEIRTLTLKPGTRDEFHHLYIEEALPLLKRWNFDMVAHGSSLHDENSYYVIRRFDSLLSGRQWKIPITPVTISERVLVSKSLR
jgi:hypothetical protein